MKDVADEELDGDHWLAMIFLRIEGTLENEKLAFQDS